MCPKCAKFASFFFLKNLVIYQIKKSFCYLCLTANPSSVKVLIFKLWAKILLPNQVAGFFKVYYFKKEGRDQIDFLHVHKHQIFLQINSLVFGGHGSDMPK